MYTSPWAVLQASVNRVPIADTYSRRQRKICLTEPEVYMYEEIPYKVRVQTLYIIQKFFKICERQIVASNRYSFVKPWVYLRRMMYEEWGLYSQEDSFPEEDCTGILLSEKEVDMILDLYEYSLKYADRVISRTIGYSERFEDLIDQFNARLREGSVGYRFECGMIVRVDSNLIHSEVVKPALTLLADPRFRGPQDEFLSAHEHYRSGEYKDAIVDANSAFESTLQAICDVQGWTYDSRDTADRLLKIVRANGLLPDYMGNSFDQLAATLKSGLPTVRNREGSHGQGSQPRETPDYIASYALHLAAAKIVLLVEALQATEGGATGST